MFSATEYQFIHDLLINYYNNNYENYVCITNNPIDYSNNNIYDIYCYVSKNDIIKKNNIFVFQGGKKISFDSNNYSNNNTIDKLLIEDFDDLNLVADNHEYIYSNIVSYPDLLGEYRTSLNNHLDLNFAFLVPFLIILFFLSNFIKSCFRSRR